jgi:hypothetical protein
VLPIANSLARRRSLYSAASCARAAPAPFPLTLSTVSSLVEDRASRPSAALMSRTSAERGGGEGGACTSCLPSAANSRCTFWRISSIDFSTVTSLFGMCFTWGERRARTANRAEPLNKRLTLRFACGRCSEGPWPDQSCPRLGGFRPGRSRIDCQPKASTCSVMLSAFVGALLRPGAILSRLVTSN